MKDAIENQSTFPEGQFHSGVRLAQARKLKGLMQKQIIDEKGFPSVCIKTISRWEQEGIVPSRVEEVARFFGVESWVFIEPWLSMDQFNQIILNPELQKKTKSQLMSTPGLLPSPFAEGERMMEMNRLMQLDQPEEFENKFRAGDITLKNQEGWTLLMWAAFINRTWAAEFLLNRGAELEAMEKDGLTPLLIASARGFAGMVQNLLRRKANPNQQDVQGWTALHWAVVNDFGKIVALLLKAGANPNLPDLQGRTPLSRAVTANRLELAELLLVGDANPNHQHQDGSTPLLNAQKLRYVEMSQLLKK